MCLNIKEIKKGFTLVELLVVISIIGILAAVVITIINPLKWQQRSRDASRKEDLAIVQGALERWYSDNNQYPSADKVTFDGNSSLTDLNGSGSDDDVTYLKKVPDDPTDDANYNLQYAVSSSQQNFCLCANMEDDGSVEGTSTCDDDTEFVDQLNENGDDLYCLENPF